MIITVTQEQSSESVAVIHLDGKLDSNSYLKLIDEAKNLFSGGVRHLVLDMTKLTYLSSAGIVALLNIARLFRGESLPDIEAGWNTIRSLDRERGGGMQKNVKLLNVTPEVHNVLDMVGIVDFFEMYAVPAEAVASF